MCIIFRSIYLPFSHKALWQSRQLKIFKNYDLKRPRLVILVPILAFHSSTSVFPSEAITVNLNMNLRISKKRHGWRWNTISTWRREISFRRTALPKLGDTASKPNYELTPRKSSCLCKPKGKRLNTAAVKPTASPCVRHVRCRLKFPPSREAITAALIVCDTSFWSSYQHPKLTTSLPAHSIHKLKLWQDETNMQCHESSKLLVSTCLSNLSVSSIDRI